MGDIPQGAGAALTYNFTPHWGLEADYGGNSNKYGSDQYGFDRTSLRLAQ